MFLERLAQEHRAAVISTAPTVTYRLQLAGGEELVLDNMTEYPRDKKVGLGQGVEEERLSRLQAQDNSLQGRGWQNLGAFLPYGRSDGRPTSPFGLCMTPSGMTP